jgi:photosystem II biogenesis protein Psp29
VNTVRTVSDAKRDFFQAFPRPINSVYRRVVDELLVEMHLLTVNQTFTYDPVFALGAITAYDRFMLGYEPEAERERILPAICGAVHLNAEQMRHDASTLAELAMRSPSDVKQFLTALTTTENLEPLAGTINAIAANPKFKYSRLFAIGIFTLLETADPAAMSDNEKRQELIKQVGEAIKLGEEKLSKDLDLYRSNLEKVEQARQMMKDLVEAERKKKEQRDNPPKSDAAAYASDDAQDVDGGKPPEDETNNSSTEANSEANQ